MQTEVDHWLRGRLQAWQRIDALLPALEDDKPVAASTALDVLEQYPEVARDLAIAQRVAPNGRLAAHLARTYGRLHRILLQAPRPPLRELAARYRAEIPQIVAALWRHIASVTTGFVLAMLAGWWLVATYPELASLFASEKMIEQVSSGQLWTDDLLNVVPPSLLSVKIFTNNIFVALTTLALGVLYGLGTIYIIGLNGLMLGGVFAFTAQHGLGMRLFEFVCAHGFVELSVICVAGAIGFSIGESLARPGHLTRTEAFQRSVAQGSKLLLLCMVFLVGAGLIEGYVSPNPAYSPGARLVIGLGYWMLFVLALGGFGSGRKGARLIPSAATSAADTARKPEIRAAPAR